MRIGGFQKISLIDYPKHLTAIIWTPGCNLRCPFCYNRDLVFGETPLIDEETIFNYLKKRRGVLEALTITGGEPTLQPDLADFIKKVRELGYLIKLDSNGTNPHILEKLFDEKLIDYISMDIKAPEEKYNILAGVKIDIENIKKSINLIRERAPAYEFRTTVVPRFLTREDIIKIAEKIKGSKCYILQQFESPVNLIDQKLKKLKPYKEEFFRDLEEKIASYFECFDIRGL